MEEREVLPNCHNSQLERTPQEGEVSLLAEIDKMAFCGQNNAVDGEWVGFAAFGEGECHRREYGEAYEILERSIHSLAQYFPVMSEKRVLVFDHVPNQTFIHHVLTGHDCLVVLPRYPDYRSTCSPTGIPFPNH